MILLDDAHVIVLYMFIGLCRRFFHNDRCCDIFFVYTFGWWRLFKVELF
jgi:hypothetical protein